MRNIFVLCVLVVVAVNGDHGNDEQRIVGGSIAQENQFPHQASIRNARNLRHICGATIIHKRWFLTAASCVLFEFSKPASIRVFVGSRINNLSGSRHSINKIIVHPRFSDSTVQNDIALLRTANDIIFNSKNTSAINLPTHEPQPGLAVVMSGWGQFTFPLTSSTDVVSQWLRFVKTKTISREDCIRRHGPNSRLIHPNTICTSNERNYGACMGDYGGPLIDPKAKVLVGIASWSIPCARGFPDVYQRVFPHIGWINLYLKE